MVQRVLVLGAGGGADSVSAHALAEYMRAELGADDMSCAGWLNPKFDHFFGGRYEQPVNQAGPVLRFRRTSSAGSGCERPLSSYERAGIAKPMVDSELWRMATLPVWHLSTRYGLQPIVEFVASYDVVVAVDVGGDILYSGQADNSVRTPALDAVTLVTMRMVLDRESPPSCTVVVLGLGTDGEMDASRLAANLGTLEAAGGLRWKQLDHTGVSFLRRLLPCLVGDSGKTARLVVDTWDAVSAGRSVRPVGGRDMRPYERWFNVAAIIPATAMFALNPLSSGTSYPDIVGGLARLGWRGG